MARPTSLLAVAALLLAACTASASARGLQAETLAGTAGGAKLAERACFQSHSPKLLATDASHSTSQHTTPRPRAAAWRRRL